MFWRVILVDYKILIDLIFVFTVVFYIYEIKGFVGLHFSKQIDTTSGLRSERITTYIT